MFQYAVPVVKYDRKGYKARVRQLLLTQNAIFIVEEAKIKQRIDYANLTGKATAGHTIFAHLMIKGGREDSRCLSDLYIRRQSVRYRIAFSL